MHRARGPLNEVEHRANLDTAVWQCAQCPFEDIEAGAFRVPANQQRAGACHTLAPLATMIAPVRTSSATPRASCNWFGERTATTRLPSGSL